MTRIAIPAEAKPHRVVTAARRCQEATGHRPQSDEGGWEQRRCTGRLSESGRCSGQRNDWGEDGRTYRVGRRRAEWL